MDSKITFVIVPGAWHPASLYDEFTSRLRDAGYGAVVATYPSCGSPNPQTATCEQDTDVLRQQCISLIEDGGKELLLVCHSYGGIPGGGAAFGLSKKDRLQEGKEGGVIGLVYMAAFVVPEGISLFDFLGRQHAPYVISDTPSEGMVIISPAIETLFNDVDRDTASRLVALLLPHANLAFESPAPKQAWTEPAYQGKRAFLRCTQDQALPSAVQDMFVQRSGLDLIVKDVDAGHEPHISRPSEVCEAVIGFAASFQGSS
ncbi:MAG: hypothetical protein Q9177_001079 [Variospora cf. flavescens]